MTPAVSVLMPARDAAATIGATMESLRAQTRGDFDVVLVDDGSRDDTADRATAAFGHDRRLRVLRPGPVGLVAALNLGLHACRAPLVARMDADDLALPRRLELQLKLLADQPDVAIVGTQVRTFRDAGVLPGYERYDAWQNRLLSHGQITKEIFVESPLAHPSVVFRKEAVLGIGGYRDLDWPEDYDLWLRAHGRGLRFAKVPQVLLHWRDTPSRASRLDARYSQPAFLRCKAHFLAQGPLAGANEVVVWGAGPIGRRLGRWLQAEGVRIRAFVDIDPRKIDSTRRGVPIVAPGSLPSLRSIPLVAAVGTRGARDIIRAEATAMGRREGTDFWCAA